MNASVWTLSVEKIAAAAGFLARADRER